MREEVAPAVIGGPASRAACAQFAAPPWAWSSCRLAVIPVRRSSGRPARGAIGSGVGKVLEANPF